jgi:predicted extracellular nuclease
MLGRIGRCGIGVALLAVASAGNAAVVISQVYGGAGCGTAGCSTYKNDYVEIFNNSAGAVNVNGWSVQYASATGTTTWQVTSLPNVSIPAGGYLLVGENGNANGNNDLPTPDVSGTLNMSATAGKVALVNSTTALNGACPIDGTVQDEVGYGATANCSETSPAPTFGDNTKAIFRAGSGCTDTGNNSTDFSPGSATPRNSASPVHLCGTVVTVDDVSHDEGNSSTTDFTFTVSLSAAAPAGGVTFDIATHDGTATVADGDYVENSATGVTIAEGETQAMFTVQVNGDTTAEADETFTVDVSNIAGTGVASTSAQGTGTIVNDDAVPATLSIDDVTHAEGDGGTTDFTFTVSLSAPAPVGGVTFDIATSDGTALVADLDYDMKALTSQSIAEGLTDYSFTVTVNGDTKYEADETFKVDVTNIVGSNVVTTAQHGTGTIVNDDPIRIGEIQGNGLASPYVGQTLTTAGNIVTAVGPKGFAMQDPVGDGDPDTSDGIYVFTNSAPTVSIGDVVTVTAQVQEFNNTTELGASPIVMVTGVGAPIGPIVLDTSLPSPNPDLHLCTGTLPATNASAGNWECIENMLVQIDGVVTGATNGGFAADGAHPGTPGFFFATVGDAPKPFREPGLIYPGAGGSIPVWDGNPEVIEFYPPGALGGPSAIVANAGQHFTSTSIVGDFKGTYELYPVTFSTTGAPPQTVVAVPAPVPGTLTIASQNMLRFFNDVKDSGSIDNCTGTSDTCPRCA